MAACLGVLQHRLAQLQCKIANRHEVLVRFGGDSDHEVQLQVLHPRREDHLCRFEDSVVGQRLVDDTTQSIGAGLGRDGDRLFAALPQQTKNRRCDVVESQRRRADAVAHIDQPREDLFDLRVVAQRDRHQTCAARVRPRLLSQLEDAVLRERTNREVVVTRPAEATQVRAPAHDFDEESRSEFGIGREDGRRRRVHRCCRLQRGLVNDRRCTGPVTRHECRDRSVAGVLHVVKGRHVEPAFRDQPPQQIVTIDCGGEGPYQWRNQRFAFTGRDDVGKRRQRLRVHERHRAADHHQRIVGRAMRGQLRNAREPQQRQHVRVVPLERDGEREDVELADRGLRFERDEGRAGGELRGELGLRRQKHPLTDDVVFGVEQLVDRLEPEVRHAYEVGIGKGQRNAQLAAVGLAHESHFLRQKVAGTLTLLPHLAHVISNSYG